MEKPFQLPGVHIYEYLLLLRIPGGLCRRIEEEREIIVREFGLKQPQPGRPNIPLAHFRMMKQSEEKMIQRLEKIAEGQKPFQVGLQDYRGYPMHALLVDVQNQQKILDLVKSIKPLRKWMQDGKEAPYFISDPNIVLAGRLTNDQYIAIMNEYMRRKFRDQFLVESFLLLRKSKEEEIYTPVKEFGFQKKAAKKAQPVLFS